LQAPNSEYGGWYGDWRLNRYKTDTQLVTGAGTAFAGPKGPRKADITGKTILLVNASSHKVYWTKPADAGYAADKPLSDVLSPPRKSRNGVFNTIEVRAIPVLLSDGTYKMMQPGEQEKDIRALIVGWKGK